MVVLVPASFNLADVIDTDLGPSGFGQHLVIPPVDAATTLLPSEFQIHSVDADDASLGVIAGPFPGTSTALDFTLAAPLPERYQVFGKFGDTLQPVAAAKVVRNSVDLSTVPPSGAMTLGLSDIKIVTALVDDLHVTIKQGSSIEFGASDVSHPVNRSSVRYDADGTTNPTTISLLWSTNGNWNNPVTPNEFTTTAMHEFLEANNWIYGTTSSYYSALPAGADAVVGNSGSLHMTQSNEWGQHSNLIVGSSDDDVIQLNTATTVVAGLNGRDHFDLTGWKITSWGGNGDDYYVADMTWEDRPNGEAGNDTFYFKVPAAAAMTNSQLYMGTGNDCVFMASSPAGAAFADAPYIINQGNILDLGADNDLLVVSDVQLDHQQSLTMNLGSGNDAVLFAPSQVKLGSGAADATLDGGSGNDTFYYHGAIPRLDNGGALVGTMQDVLGTVNFDVKGFEQISMKGIDGAACSTPPQKAWNNAGVVTLKLTQAEIQKIAAGNALGGNTLIVDGDTDGKDRVDLSTYVANPSCDTAGHKCYCSGPACLVVQQGLSVSLDGTSYAPL